MAFMTSRTPLWALFALLGACAGTPKQVTSVAQIDLGCEQIQTAEIAPNRYAASGCGRGGVYARLCGAGECSWVRLRGSEQPQAVSSPAVATGNSPPREVIQAPPPAPREIIQAPPPAQREIIPAPPPAGQSAAPAPSAPDVNQATPAATGDGQLQSYTPEPTPLSQGELSKPYQTEIPVQPVAQRVEYPPPAPLIEQRPPPPRSSYVWVGGYWSWGMNSWLWAPGYWCAPRYGFSYVPGSWYWANNYWWYGPGGWARPGSTYIVHHVGPRSDRYRVTRSFSPYRTTQGQPSRMGTNSFGGGPGSAPSRMGTTSYGANGGGAVNAPSRMGTTAYPSHLGNGGRPARMGAVSADRGYTPQGSPLYRYPTTVAPAARPSRMGAVRPGAVNGGNGGFSRSVQPSSGSSPQRFGAGTASPGSVNNSNVFRSAPMGRMPSASPAPSRGSMGRMGGGGVGRMGGGGGGGRGGGGGGGRGPGTIRR